MHSGVIFTVQLLELVKLMGKKVGKKLKYLFQIKGTSINRRGKGEGEGVLLCPLRNTERTEKREPCTVHILDENPGFQKVCQIRIIFRY